MLHSDYTYIRKKEEGRQVYECIGELLVLLGRHQNLLQVQLLVLYWNRSSLAHLLPSNGRVVLPSGKRRSRRVIYPSR